MSKFPALPNGKSTVKYISEVTFLAQKHMQQKLQKDMHQKLQKHMHQKLKKDMQKSVLKNLNIIFYVQYSTLPHI